MVQAQPVAVDRHTVIVLYAFLLLIRLLLFLGTDLSQYHICNRTLQ